MPEADSGKMGGLLQEIRTLCVSSSVSSKWGTTGLLKQLAALRPISRAVGSLAAFELLEIALRGQRPKQDLSEAPQALCPTNPAPAAGFLQPSSWAAAAVRCW